MNCQHLSRRELLRTAAVTSLGIIAAACGATPTPTPPPLQPASAIPTTAAAPAATATQAAATPAPASRAPKTMSPSLGNLGYVAYVLRDDVWVKSLPSGEPQRLTSDGYNSSPRWSPTGQWLAVQKRADQLWVMRKDGTAPRQIAGCALRLNSWSWSPVQDRLACATTTGSLMVTAPDGVERQELVPSPNGGPNTGVLSLAWSHDGKELAYAREDTQTTGTPAGRTASLWRIAAAGGQPAPLYDAAAASDELIVAGWSGDDKYVLYWTNQGFSASMLADGAPFYAISPNRGSPPLRLGGDALLPTGGSVDVILAHSDFVAAAPAAPAGSKVAVILGGYRGTWTRKRVAIADLGMVNSPSRGITAVTNADQAASSPVWSPDASRLAYAAMPDRGDLVGGDTARQGLMERRLWLANSSGAPEPRQLTNDPAYRDERPLWSADGAHLLFARLSTDDQPSLWLLSLVGGPPQKVADLSFLSTDKATWFGYYGYMAWDTLFDWLPAVE